MSRVLVFSSSVVHLAEPRPPLPRVIVHRASHPPARRERPPMPDLTRRRLFGAAGAVAAATFAAEFLPAGVRRAMAETPERLTGSLADIKHVVILMQENRSFDHYF